MTTTVYCKKDIDEFGDYKRYDCPKLKEDSKHSTYWGEICEHCKFNIPEGKEIPAP